MLFIDSIFCFGVIFAFAQLSCNACVARLHHERRLRQGSGDAHRAGAAAEDESGDRRVVEAMQEAEISDLAGKCMPGDGREAFAVLNRYIGKICVSRGSLPGATFVFPGRLYFQSSLHPILFFNH